VKEIRWNALKNDRLKKVRGVSFEELLGAELVAVKRHPRRQGQKVLLFFYKKYVWVVPYVEEDNGYFLKTLYPSRKLTKLHKRGAM